MSNKRFPTKFGRYILLDKLAAGGMAEVFCAKVTGLGSFQKLLAIKCMLAALSRDQVYMNMFVDEANLASKLCHPNIVQIYELGRIQDSLFIAMELIHGKNVGALICTALNKKIKIPYAFSAHIIAKAAEGLDFAHSKISEEGKALNIVHRDVSPQNILVSYDGAVKLVDFGIAKADERAVRMTSNLLKGKLGYMSPEQANTGMYDKRSDLFALGVVLWELIACRRLFEGRNQFSVMEKVRKAQIPPIKKIVPEVPPALAEITERSLSPDPKERYQSAEEMGEALTLFFIKQGSIYSGRQTSRFMESLFIDIIQSERIKVQRYMRITLQDCKNNMGQDGSSELFRSRFEEAKTEKDVQNLLGQDDRELITRNYTRSFGRWWKRIKESRRSKKRVDFERSDVSFAENYVQDDTIPEVIPEGALPFFYHKLHVYQWLSRSSLLVLVGVLIGFSLLWYFFFNG